jgi:predicted RNase H-like nuclease (RuvC/YqgF family)
MEKRIQNLEDAVADLKAEIGGTDAEEEEEEEDKEEELSKPGKNPRTKTTKTTETIEFSIEELKAENEKLKAELEKTPAEAPVKTHKFSKKGKSLSKTEFGRLGGKEKFLHNLYK